MHLKEEYEMLDMQITH